MGNRGRPVVENSSRQQAIKLIGEMSSHNYHRDTIVQHLIDNLGVAPSTAKQYYYNFRNGAPRRTKYERIHPESYMNVKSDGT